MTLIKFPIMPEDLQPTETHEVDKTVEKKGEVQFLSKEAFKNPAPKGLQIALVTIKKFIVYASGVMAATTVFSGNQTKVIIFAGSLLYGLCDAIQAGTGVVNPNDKS